VTALVLLALSLPCIVAAQDADGRAALERARVTRLCTDANLGQREPLPTPGTTPRPGIASPTRAPWIVANGWRFMRRPETKYLYDVPTGKAALAAAEAFAYDADAALKIDPADAQAVAEMLTFLAAVPAVGLPPASDFAVVDDGSPLTGEVMNLLARRNLLFAVVQAPAPQYRINVRIGSAEYARAEAADPSAFALKIRRQLTDEQRALRIYGSEVVICRLTAAAGRARLHLINYGGREIEGLRIRLRGAYGGGAARVAGIGPLTLQDRAVVGGATEFSLPRLTSYAVIDLQSAR
jgi:hypothetical protein